MGYLAYYLNVVFIGGDTDLMGPYTDSHLFTMSKVELLILDCLKPSTQNMSIERGI